MRYAIISDIHSNLEALTGVLKVIEKEEVDKIVCAGDVIGYGADPVRCLEIVRDVCSLNVAGNHDHCAVGLTDTDYFNNQAKIACAWTAEQVNKEGAEYLKNLSLKEKTEDFMIVHSTPLSPGEWEYITSTFTAYKNFEAFQETICFVGHSHIPVTFSMMVEKGRCDYSFDSEVTIVDGRRYIINVGSVGQPRDGDARACFALYDTGNAEVRIKRVKYDIETAREKIVDAGLPPGLASRLSSGL